MTTAERLSARGYVRAPESVNKKAVRVLFMLVCALMIAPWTTAAQVPDVTVDGATVTSTTAKITGTVNPNGLPTAFHVIYGPTPAYGYTGSYGPLPAENTPLQVTNILTGLTPSSTYHYQLVATNGSGVGHSVDMTFTTLASGGPLVPVVTIDGATSTTSSNATISGTVNPNGSEAGYFVQWGLTTAYGGGGPVGSLAAGNSPLPVSAQMLGLSPSTTYHYRLAATNFDGIGYSGDMTLTTSAPPPPPPPVPPTVTTGTATSVTATNATITGMVNPNSSATTYYFQWGTSVGYGNFTSLNELPGQSTPSSIYGYLTDLAADTTYHYRLVATNAGGTTLGADQQFTTPAQITLNGHTFTYIVTNGSVTITAYAGPGGNVVIPSTIVGLPVTGLGDGAFYSYAFNSTVTGVAIPDTVTSIGDASFKGCVGLTNVVIPDSVTYLGDEAFCACQGLATITIGKGITAIKGGGDRNMFGTFQWCASLTRVTIPDNVTNITDGSLHLGGSLGAFYFCSLTNVIIGKGLTYLGTGAFSYNTGLVAAYFQGDAPTPGRNMFGEDIFHVDPLAIAYYMPGTTGWGTTYAGIPAVLWNPQLQSGNNNFAGGMSQFGFNVIGTADIPIAIEACTNPGGGDWVPLQSCTLTNGSISFSDPQSLTLPARFYRIRSP